MLIRHEGARLGFQPRIRRSAFFEAAWRHGCRNFSVYNRTYITGVFSDPDAEYWSVVHDVALWPAMGERQVEVSGPDAERFVQRLTPRNMSKTAVGQCRYALITAQDGGILCDPIILRLAEDRFWLSTSDVDLELWAKGVAVNSGLSVNVSDANVAVLQVQGPKSRDLLVDMFGAAIAELKYFRFCTVPFEGADLVVSRTGWSGELGYELYLSDATRADALFDGVLEAGVPYAIRPGAVSQARRIEAGMLSWGVDVTPNENPYEVGLGRLVDLTVDAPFIGKSNLARLSTMEPTRRLVGLTVPGPRLASNETAWPLRDQGRTVGQLTSLAYSPRLETNIGLGIVETAASELDLCLEVETWNGVAEAVVSALPFTPTPQNCKI